MERIRLATPEDHARSIELFEAATGEALPKRGGDLLHAVGPGTQPDAGTTPASVVSSWITDDDAQLLIGEFDGATVGLAAGRVHGGTPSLGRIECCFVEPAARGVGVGSALIEGLLEWFTSQGCAGVDALALPGDREMKQLFEMAGFKTRLLVLHRSIT